MPLPIPPVAYSRTALRASFQPVMRNDCWGLWTRPRPGVPWTLFSRYITEDDAEEAIVETPAGVDFIIVPGDPNLHVAANGLLPVRSVGTRTRHACLVCGVEVQRGVRHCRQHYRAAVASDAPPCRNCQTRAGSRAGGLCCKCAGSPAIRAKYPPRPTGFQQAKMAREALSEAGG